jgi:hypothetical protein
MGHINSGLWKVNKKKNKTKKEVRRLLMADWNVLYSVTERDFSLLQPVQSSSGAH